MAVSSILTNTWDWLSQADARSGSPPASKAAKASDVADVASPPPATVSAPEPSTQVTLSADAQALARINAEGVTVTQGSIMGLHAPGGSPSTSIQQLMDAVRSLAPHTNSQGQADGYVCGADFETMIAQRFGRATVQVPNLFNAFDIDGSGSISNPEMLSAMSSTGSDPTSSSSQALLHAMDTNGDGTVSVDEYTQFETAMVEAEKTAS